MRFIVHAELIFYAKCFTSDVSKDLGNLVNKEYVVLLAYGKKG